MRIKDVDLWKCGPGRDIWLAGALKDDLMRVHLRDVRTGKFLGKGKVWTEKQIDAFDFGSGDEAIQAWSVSREDSVEMVYAFGGEKCDLSIALGTPTGMVEQLPDPVSPPPSSRPGWT